MRNKQHPVTCYLDFLVILGLLVDLVLKYRSKYNFSFSIKIFRMIKMNEFTGITLSKSDSFELAGDIVGL